MKAQPSLTGWSQPRNVRKKENGLEGHTNQKESWVRPSGEASEVRYEGAESS